MALNALRSEMVTFTGTPGFEANGVTVGYKAEYTPRTGTESKYNAIEGRTSDVASDANHKGQYYIQLGEQLYDGDLRLNNSDLDCFQRPSRTWEYKGEQIGTYMKKELLRQEYTEKVTGKMLYDLLSKNTIETYDFVIAIDGETDKKVLAPEGGSDYGYFTEGNLVRTNTDAVGKTGKGVLTQVFVDNNSEDPTVYIAVINTYLAKANDDYNERKDEVSFTIWSVDYKNKALVKDTTVNTVSRDVKGEDFDIKDVKDGDIVLVRVAEDEIKQIIAPEILSDLTINSFSKKDWVTVGGTKYDYASSAQYDTDTLHKYSNSNLKELTYNVVLDMYGYLIGIEQNEDPDQYVFITGNDGGASDLRNGEAEMAAIFLDGTMKVIKVNMKDSTGVGAGAIVNTWCTYSVNSKDVYTLEAVSTSYNEDHGQWAQNVKDGGSYVNGAGNPSTTYTIDKGHVSLVASSNGLKSDRRVYGNDKTVYINVETSVINAKTEYTNEGSDGAATTETGNGISKITSEAADTSNYYLKTNDKKQVVIIDDVESVTTGVKNANILVKDVKAGDYSHGNNDPYEDTELAVPKSEIYTLYEGGDVIAVITIGDDQGTSSKYVYVHTDDVEWEEYGHSSAKAVEGKWRWEREVIMDGEITSLYEVTDSNYAKIDERHMIQGNWYKVAFDADGNVRRVEDTSQWAAYYATDVENVEDYYDDNKDITILEVDYRSSHLTNGLRFEDGTLYTDYTNRKGFSVSPNVKVVYANAKLKNSVKEPTGNFADVIWFNDTVDGYTDYSGVRSVLKLIHSRDAGYFCGVLNAVIEDGVATTIIINDTYGEYVDKGESSEPVPTVGKYSSAVDAGIAAEIDGDPLDLAKAEVNDDNELVLTAHVGTVSVKQQLLDTLAAKGYKVSKATISSGTWTFTVSKDGMEEEITCDTSSDLGDEYVMVTVDSEKQYVEVTGTVAIEAPGTNPGTGYIIKETGDTAFAYGATYGNYTATTGKDAEIKTGYIQVATSITPGAAAAGVTVVAGAAIANDYAKTGETITYNVSYHTGGTAIGAAAKLTLTVDASATGAVPGPIVSIASGTNIAAATPTAATMTVVAGTADITPVTVTPAAA